MKYLLIFLVIAAAAFYGWREHSKPSPAYQAYLKFEDATQHGDCSTLNALTEGQARAWVDNYCGGRFSAASMVAELSGTPAGAMRSFSYTRESELEGADGTVSMVILGKVNERPSNFSKPRAPWRDTIKLKRNGE